MVFSSSDEMKTVDITAEMMRRKQDLQKILNRNGMELRDDSKLSHNYILNGGDVFMVAHEVLCTHFLFCNTPYNQMCQLELRQMAYEMKKQYKLSWTKTWEIVREYGVPALKAKALLVSGKIIPNFVLQM